MPGLLSMTILCRSS